jgi:acyl dehydratase
MKVGDVARRSRKIDPEDIELFAAMTGDRNPVHFDAELAAGSRFGGIVVQGGVTSGLLNALVAMDMPGPGSVFLHTDWNYRAPVRPGDVLTAEATVLEMRADKPISTLQTIIRNQDDVIVLDGTVIVWRDPHVAGITDTGTPDGSAS